MTNPVAAARFVVFGPFRFDPVNRVLLRDGAELPLPPRVLAVLECLLEQPGRIIPRQDIIDRVWRDAYVTDTSLAEAISFLRQTLGDAAQSPAYIQTFHRRGYRFVASVTHEPEERSPLVEEGAAMHTPAAGDPLPSIGNALMPWSLVILLGAIASVAVWKVTHPPHAGTARSIRFEVPLPANLTLRSDRQSLAVAPNGTSLAFAACDAARCRVVVRDLSSLVSHVLDGTEGAAAPFFSPDGSALGFFAGGKLKKVSLAGGAPTVLCDAPDALGGTWLDDGRIVFAGHEAGGLEIVSDAGGTPAPYTRVDVRAGDVGHRWPHWIRGSAYVLFTAIGASPPRSLAISRASGAAQTISGRAAGVQFLSPELVILGRGPEVLAARFEQRLGTLSTVPTQIATNLLAAGDGAPMFAASDGALLQAGAAGATRPSTYRLIHDFAEARTSTPTGPWMEWRELRLDPSGGRVAGVALDGTRTELWIADLARRTAARVALDRSITHPFWTRDGRAIVFSASDGGAYNLWRADVSSGNISRLTTATAHQFATDVARSGVVVYTQVDGTGRGDIWRIRADGGTESLARSRFDERGGVLSPDERALAYESDESGPRQLYVKPLDTAARHVVAAADRTRAGWRSDALLMYEANGVLWETTIAADGTPSVPRQIIDIREAELVDALADTALLRSQGRHSVALHMTIDAAAEISRRLLPALAPLPR